MDNRTSNARGMCSIILHSMFDIVLHSMFDIDLNLFREASASSVENMATDLNLFQLMSEPTRETETSSSLIDLLLASDPGNFNRTGIAPVALSDHHMIYGSRSEDVALNQHSFRMGRSYAKCDRTKFHSDLETAQWSTLDSIDDINTRWHGWKKLFLKIMDSHVPVKKMRVRKSTMPWVDGSVRKLMRARSYFHTKAVRTGDKEDWMKYKTLRNSVTSKLRAAKLKFLDEISLLGRNPREVWRRLNLVMGRKKGKHIGSLMVDGRELNSSSDKAEALNSFFSSCVNEVGQVHDTTQDLPITCSHNLQFVSIDEESVNSHLGRLKIDKATGVDGISARMLKLTAPAISKSLASLFNYSLECGDLPLEWKAANVSPVLKKGDSRVPSNYRPISVLPVVAKILEKCVHQQVYTYMQNHQLLHPAQFGFRPGHSTQDAVLACIEDWRRSLDDDKLVGVAFIDLSKAFDSINHKLLLQKLESYGFGDREMRWFYRYLAGRKQRVVIEGSHSSWSNVTRGVPQGSILGPLLFMIFVNDLPSTVEQGTAVMYADDTTLYQCSSDAIGLQEKLTAGLVKIANWLCQNKLSMNVQKTQLLLLSRKRRAKDLENIQIALNGEVIKKQDCVKYLGVLIDSSLSWEKHISRTRKKCYSGLSQQRRLGSIPPNLKKQLYNSLVLPHLDYCSVVWQEGTMNLLKSIEQVQN